MARIELITDNASAEELDATIAFLTTLWRLRDVPEPPVAAKVAAALKDAHLHLTDGEQPLPPPAPPAPPAPTGTGYEHIFGQNATAAAPQVPPPPAAPAAPSTAGVATSMSVPEGTTGSLAPSPVGELDAKGNPWDERIHASSKAKVVDGTWKYKRNVDKALIEQVELMNAIAVSAPVVPVLTDVVSVAPPPPPPPGTSGVVPLPPGIPGVPAPPSASSLPPPPPAAAAKAMSFVDFMKFVLPLIQAKRVTHEQVNAACKQAGISAMTLLNQHPTKIPVVVEAINALLLAPA